MVAEIRHISRARIGLVQRSSANAYALFVALVMLDCDVSLLDEAMTPERLRELLDSHCLDATLDPSRDVDLAVVRQLDSGTGISRLGRGEITIVTSGSTGRPKPVRHNWGSLTRPVRSSRSSTPLCWLLTFRPHLYAGLQVFLHCLLNQETLVIPEEGMPVEGLLEFMCRYRLSAVSSTPSYWRRLVALGNRDSLKAVPLEQITLGGEAVDQRLLSALNRLYPRARLVHIYATSELGRCFSVQDALAGFPADFLNRATAEGVELKVEDGELHVRSANAVPGLRRVAGSRDGKTDWIATTDLVERVGDRYFFVGRRSDVINVGGNKVHPLSVEQVVQVVPGVRDARVFAQSSSLAGAMVACEFVAEPGFDPESVRRAIQQACLDRLSAHERPRLIRIAESITLSGAGKKIRGPAH
jgi:acyl-coenzyme A synthetase/AMP-(fatty) acid ligase